MARRSKKILGRIYVITNDEDLDIKKFSETLKELADLGFSEITMVVGHRGKDISYDFRILGWMAYECNEADFAAIDEVLKISRNHNNGRPQVIFANTVAQREALKNEAEYKSTITKLMKKAKDNAESIGLGKLNIISV